MLGISRGLAVALASLALLTAAGQADTAPVSQPRALFFGDSLFVGAGAVPRRPVQPQAAAGLLGWHGVVDAWGGTGYTTGGRSGRTYLQRLHSDGFLRSPYDVIVLEGGTNDAHHGTLGILHREALRTVDYVQRRQPGARIVLVGAFAARGVDRPERYAAVDRVLAAVAAERGLQYVSQHSYAEVTDPAFLAKDRFHPSDAGYVRMARDLAEALREG